MPAKIFRDPDTEETGEVIVAGARLAPVFFFLGSRAVTRRAGIRDADDTLQHVADLRAGETEIAVPSLFCELHEIGPRELRKMSARGLWRNPCGIGKLTCRQGAAIQECAQHIRARRISDQRCDFRDFVHAFHGAEYAVTERRLPQWKIRSGPKHSCEIGWSAMRISALLAAEGNGASCLFQFDSEETGVFIRAFEIACFIYDLSCRFHRAPGHLRRQSRAQAYRHEP